MEDGVSESLKERVYYAARDGLAITLYALLAEAPNPEKLLAEVCFICILKIQ
jgi:hypothetical protein